MHNYLAVVVFVSKVVSDMHALVAIGARPSISRFGFSLAAAAAACLARRVDSTDGCRLAVFSDCDTKKAKGDNGDLLTASR